MSLKLPATWTIGILLILVSLYFLNWKLDKKCDSVCTNFKYIQIGRTCLCNTENVIWKEFKLGD